MWNSFVTMDKEISEANSKLDYPDRFQNPGYIIGEPKWKLLVPRVQAFCETFEQSDIATFLETLGPESRFIAPPPVEPLFAEELLEVSDSGCLKQICVARMRFALEAKDHDTFNRALRHALVVSRSVQGRARLLNSLVAQSTYGFVDSQLRQWVLEGMLDENTARAAFATIGSFPFPGLASGYAGERFVILQAIDFVFAQAGGEVPSTSPWRAFVSSGFGALVPRDDRTATTNKLIDGAVDLFSDDPGTHSRGAAAVNAVNDLLDHPPQGRLYEPLKTVAPVVNQALREDRKYRAVHEGVRVLLALELWKTKHARYPDQLTDLVPEVLDRLPKDPFACDRDLTYRLLDAECHDPRRAFILYSVGYDGVDNGGKKHPGHSSEATWPLGKGYDFILNVEE